MTRSELIDIARTRVDDVNEPFLVSDESFELFANEAVSEANRRAKIKLSNTLTVPILEGVSEYDLPENIILIKRMKLVNGSCPLHSASVEEMDKHFMDWEDDEGEPLLVIMDDSQTRFTLYPEPISADTLKITALTDTIDGEELDLPQRYHNGLIDWLAYRYYGIHDADVHDPQVADRYYAKFEEEFGKRSSADNEVFNNRTIPFDELIGGI